MQNALYMLFGAALVAIGVLAAALADRIRGIRASRETAPRERASRAPSVPAQSARQVIPVVELPRAPMPKQPKARPEPKADTEGGDDVIAALVAAGFKKPVATEATWACSASERATIESWTASALRRCARGAAS
jgi:Holliday junction resolvasome RuvABC DNA-binding subunit